MKNRTFILIIFISTLIVLFVTIGSFLLKFSEQLVSSDVANWGQFGDYMGGILNPIFSLLNLIVLIYLTVKLVEVETERNKWTVQELARPYGMIEMSYGQNFMTISLDNHGMGPLLISKLIIIDPAGNVYKDFSEVKRREPDEQVNEEIFYSTDGFYGSVPKDDRIVLFALKCKEGDIMAEAYISEVGKLFHGFRLRIPYTDIYDREINSANFVIVFK